MYYISPDSKSDIGYMEAVVSKLMKRGVKVADCAELHNELVESREALKEQLYSKYGIVNPNSSQQVVAYIQTLSKQVDLKVKNDIVNICYDEGTGKWTSKADALEKLADMGYDFAQDLLDYRHSKKYAETIESMLREVDENGMIHPQVSIGRTNRVHYSKPALLNIPKELVWRLIKPYSTDKVLYSADIKNQEPNILINFTNAEELKPALTSENGLYETMFSKCFTPRTVANVLVDTLPENRRYTSAELSKIGTVSPVYYKSFKADTDNLFYKDKRVVGIEVVCVGSTKGVKPDLPDTVGIEVENGDVYDVPVIWDDYTTKYKRSADYKLSGELQGLELKISKAERKEFKTAWLAMSYGASYKGIVENCKIIDGKRVYEYITKINGLAQYRKYINEMIKKGHNVIRTAFGTPIYLDTNLDDKAMKRTLMNLPIQGTGADILSLLIKRIEDYTTDKELGDNIKLYFTRHDELVLEVDKSFESEVGTDKIKEIILDMLEHQIGNWVPFKLEVERIGE